MEENSECLRISRECRGILLKPHYSAELSAKLIGWLQHPNAAVSDIAGRCLLKLGERAFDDLLAEVTTSSALPWANALWVLSGFPSRSNRLLPLLRSWLSASSGELESHIAVALARTILARKREGHSPHPEDVLVCTHIMERYILESPGMRVHYRSFITGLKENPIT